MGTIVDPNGNEIEYSRDQKGNLISHTDANGGITQFTYDSLDRVLSKTDALTAVESYLYEPGGRLQQRVDRKGQVSGALYDGLGCLVQRGHGASPPRTPNGGAASPCGVDRRPSCEAAVRRAAPRQVAYECTRPGGLMLVAGRMPVGEARNDFGRPTLVHHMLMITGPYSEQVT